VTSAGGGALRGLADPFLLGIMLAALLLRLHLAVTAEYIHDEQNNAIPLSKTITFSPVLNLPHVNNLHTSFSLGEVKAGAALPLGHLGKRAGR